MLLKNLTITPKPINLKRTSVLQWLAYGLVFIKYKFRAKYRVTFKLKQKRKFAPLPNFISAYEKGEIQESNARILTRLFNCIDVS